MYEFLFDLHDISAQRILYVMERYGEKIIPELKLLFRSANLNPIHKKYILELLIKAGVDDISDEVMVLYMGANDVELRYKCVKYGEATKDDSFIDVFKEEIFSHDHIMCYLVLKYFYAIDYFDDTVLIFAFFYTDDLLIKKQVVQIFHKHYSYDFPYIIKGRISPKFEQLMQEGLNECLTKSSSFFT